MKLYPCVLLGDFGTAKLADTITTEQQYRWSTTDDANLHIDLTRAIVNWDRRSLRLYTSATTATGDKAEYGASGTVITGHDVANSFGATSKDLTWCTNLASWMYHTANTQGDGANTFQMIVTNNGVQDIVVNWPASFNDTDKWIWATNTPTWGTFAANGNNTEQFKYQCGTVAGDFDDDSYFYLNSFVAYRSTISNGVGGSDNYTWTDGVELKSSSYIPTGWNSWRVTGNLLGDDILDISRQLHEMETIGLEPMSMVRRPTPKYQALPDCGNIKVYLMHVEENLGVPGDSVVTCAVPVIISNVSVEWVAPSKKILSFSFDASRFAGV